MELTAHEGKGRLIDNHEKITASVTSVLKVQRRPTCLVMEEGVQARPLRGSDA